MWSETEKELLSSLHATLGRLGISIFLSISDLELKDSFLFTEGLQHDVINDSRCYNSDKKEIDKQRNQMKSRKLEKNEKRHWRNQTNYIRQYQPSMLEPI